MVCLSEIHWLKTKMCWIISNILHFWCSLFIYRRCVKTLSIPSSTISELVQKNSDLFSHLNLQLLAWIVVISNDCKKVSRQLFIFLSRGNQNTISPDAMSAPESPQQWRGHPGHPSRVVTPAPSQHQHWLLSVTRTTYSKQIGLSYPLIPSIVWQSIRSWNSCNIAAFSSWSAGGWYQAVIVTVV